ncbi:hypothetical protein D3C87_765850 [compost metagenome]
MAVGETCLVPSCAENKTENTSNKLRIDLFKLIIFFFIFYYCFICGAVDPPLQTVTIVVVVLLERLLSGIVLDLIDAVLL